MFQLPDPIKQPFGHFLTIEFWNQIADALDPATTAKDWFRPGYDFDTQTSRKPNEYRAGNFINNVPFAPDGTQGATFRDSDPLQTKLLHLETRLFKAENLKTNGHHSLLLKFILCTLHQGGLLGMLAMLTNEMLSRFKTSYQLTNRMCCLVELDVNKFQIVEEAIVSKVVNMLNTNDRVDVEFNVKLTFTVDWTDQFSLPNFTNWKILAKPPRLEARKDDPQYNQFCRDIKRMKRELIRSTAVLCNPGYSVFNLNANLDSMLGDFNPTVKSSPARSSLHDETRARSSLHDETRARSSLHGETRARAHAHGPAALEAHFAAVMSPSTDDARSDRGDSFLSSESGGSDYANLDESLS